MNKSPLVSVIIPTYNSEKYLERCLKSIEMQDYPKDRIEVLMIDGGSTDRTIRIANKFTVKIINNPQREAEIGKYIGIKKSKGEVIALVDSDNVIAQTDWLSKMIVPLVEDESIIGVESQYLINSDFSLVNRYCARIKIADPLARLFASKPLIKKREKYWVLEYKQNDNPMIGANGFLWRKSIIFYLYKFISNQKFEETIFCSLAVNKGFTKFAAVPNIGIYHYYANSFKDFMNKRVKMGNEGMERRKNSNYWVNHVSKIRLGFAIIYCISIIGPTLEAFYQFAKTRDVSWFLHPITSFITILVYGQQYSMRNLH